MEALPSLGQSLSSPRKLLAVQVIQEKQLDLLAFFLPLPLLSDPVKALQSFSLPQEQLLTANRIQRFG